MAKFKSNRIGMETRGPGYLPAGRGIQIEPYRDGNWLSAVFVAVSTIQIEPYRDGNRP